MTSSQSYNLHPMDDTTRIHLTSLSKDQLLDLLQNLYGRDAGIDREIELYAARVAPMEHIQELRKTLQSWKRSRRFVGYHESFDFSHQVDDVAREVEAVVESGDPKTALELAELFLKTGNRVTERADDSAGAIFDSLRVGCRLWLRAARRYRESGVEGNWLARVQKLMKDNPNGLLDNLLPQADLLLAEDELRELARRYEEEERQAQPDETGWRWHTAAVHLGSLAWALRDPEVYADSIRLRSPEPNELQKADIVRCYLKLEQPEGALRWLEGSWERNEVERLELLAEAYEALGREEDRVTTRRKIWKIDPRRSTLQALAALLPADDQAQLQDEAVVRAQTMRSLPSALSLLLHIDEGEKAEQLLVRRYQELEGRQYTYLLDLADRLRSEEHHLAATLLYRALLDSILQRGTTRAYGHGARYLRTLGELAPQVKDWCSIPDHDAYLEALREHHGRKYSFWKRVES
ncbi:MAG: hypothetical protein SX243_12045 [Acidobacteriota bacterium]|nr:hypothetical protein [Acidobacteriota bacterium]